MAYYNIEIKSLFSEFNSSEKGLKSAEIDKKIEKYGKNTIEKQKKVSFFKKLIDQFKNVMIIILIISAIISIATSITENDRESLFEGILIFFIVLINSVVGVLQEQKAENALLALEKQTEPFANVIRDGISQKVRVHNLVPGDIVKLKTGDIIPADIRIISCSSFMCNESSLTGESHSIPKTSATLKSKNLAISDQENICFSGTSVTSGKATGIVFATGKNTEMGKIAGAITMAKKEKTPLEKNIDKIGKFLTISIVAIVVIVFAVQVFFGKNQTIIGALLTSVALAVAAIPESLPAVITIIMALGVQRLAKKNAIVKKLSAVETLGSCNIICSDKTGTLTKNDMKVVHFFDGEKILSAESVSTNSVPEAIAISAMCNNAVITSDKIIADATETAMIKFLLSKKIDISLTKKHYKKISESEFNSTKKTMSVTCDILSQTQNLNIEPLSTNSNRIIFSKGAIDYLILDCKKIVINGNIVPLTEKIKNKIMSANSKVCNLGERVIALAYGSNPNDMIFSGFFGIIDPPRAEAKQSVQSCHKAGMKVLMITGDHPDTAFAIARQIGIASSKSEVLTGQMLSNMTTHDLSKIISKYTVFARVTPEHKLMIVSALKMSGNIVAMTGDGINDAPSIKQANIGACMGITGTDVTKEVSDIIISDDDFSTIVVAIKEGRTIYNNISKTILFLLSTNIVEVLGIFITSLIMPDAIFLTPTQILFINLITDSLPAFALGIEPPEKNIMEIQPRDPSKSILSGKTGSSIIYQGFIQSLIVLIMFVSAKWNYGNEIASTMSFLTICLMQIIHAINCKSEGSIFKINIFKNHFFNFSFILLLFAIISVCFFPITMSLFDITPLTLNQWLIVSLTSISIIPLVEIGKLIIKN